MSRNTVRKYLALKPFDQQSRTFLMEIIGERTGDSLRRRKPNTASETIE